MAVKTQKIPLSETGQFSRLFMDYISAEKKLDTFYTYAPRIESFKQIIEDKSRETINRDVLTDVLKKQYAGMKKTEIPAPDLELLRDKNTFTVCTGHQLCLFTGPLYFIYKIVSTINLSEALKKKFPEYNFVPVYWMASEDHDFEEISAIHLFGKTVSWNNPEAKAAVGRLKTATLSPVIDELKTILGESANATELLQLFTDAYLEHNNLADATRYIVHRLFGEYGLVVLDPDNADLKKEFLGIIKDDIVNNTNYKLISESIKQLNALGYDAQVNPREINVFRLTDAERTRIESATPEMLDLKPEEYSPNVVLRPLYQQVILPNLAYIGGPGELAYWLEYKTMFEHHKVAFPALMPRNFALLTDDKTNQQLQKLGLDTEAVFKDTDALIKEFVSKNASAELSLKEQEDKLSAVYAEVAAKASAVDSTLKANVESELQKALNALKNIESKLVRSEKQKQETSINQIRKVKDKFFPEGTLQERYDNVAPYYLKAGKSLIAELKETFDPFDFRMMILTIH